MTSDKEIPSLKGLDYIAYIDDNGELPFFLEKKIGIYAIFDKNKIIQFIGYSRDVYFSCKQHLIRQPEKCYWLKVTIIENPNRRFLEEIEKAWINESNWKQIGNEEHKQLWINPINGKELMTQEEEITYKNPLIEDIERRKLMKNVARRIEAEILAVLERRGLKTQLWFNPKLKAEAILDLK